MGSPTADAGRELARANKILYPITPTDYPFEEDSRYARPIDSGIRKREGK
jgi:hypothetical protein